MSKSGRPDFVDGWRYDESLGRDVYPLPVGDKGGPIGLENVAEWILDEGRRNRLIQHLRRYFGKSEEVGPMYTGQLFERFVARSVPGRFTEHDVFAVQALSATLPIRTIHSLLEPDALRDRLLRSASEDLAGMTLWSCDPRLLRDNSALSRLYGLLRSQDGMGPVRTSKILSTKFPEVVPIRDGKVATLLGLTGSVEWWLPMRDLLLAGRTPVWHYVAELPLPVGSAEVAVIRKLDVLLWMEARSRSL